MPTPPSPVIRFPFGIAGAGYIATTSDPGAIVTQRAISAVATRIGERMMRGDYGSLVPDHLFDTLDDSSDFDVEVKLEEEALTSLTWNAPDIDLRTISVTGDPTRPGEYHINMQVSTDASGLDLTTSIVVNRDLLTGSSGS